METNKVDSYKATDGNGSGYVQLVVLTTYIMLYFNNLPLSSYKKIFLSWGLLLRGGISIQKKNLIFLFF